MLAQRWPDIIHKVYFSLVSAATDSLESGHVIVSSKILYYSL